jgi:hypothetical protein
MIRLVIPAAVGAAALGLTAGCGTTTVTQQAPSSTSVPAGQPGEGPAGTLSWTCTIDMNPLDGSPENITLDLTNNGSQPITIATMTVAVYDSAGDEIGNQTPLDADTVVTPGTYTSTSHLYSSELSGLAATCTVASWTAQ